jgi:HEPN domain-containing protein
MDVEAQVAFWRAGAEDDLAAARSLVKTAHGRQALFLAHLALEKMLKAHVTAQTRAVPPRTHNLLRLAALAGLELGTGRDAFLRAFGTYGVAGRYPDAEQAPLTGADACERLAQVEEVFGWLKSKS